MNAREALKQLAGFNSRNSYGRPLMEIDELLRDSIGIMREAVSNGDWHVDGRCDPDSIFERASILGYGDPK